MVLVLGLVLPVCSLHFSNCGRAPIPFSRPQTQVLEIMRRKQCFTQESLDFMGRILTSSGTGACVMNGPKKKGMPGIDCLGCAMQKKTCRCSLCLLISPLLLLPSLTQPPSIHLLPTRPIHGLAAGDPEAAAGGGRAGGRDGGGGTGGGRGRHLRRRAGRAGQDGRLPPGH